ncbi:YitT family protein, partial [Bacillus subtilis]|uniref:YitT family protein n=1 Tax=Bacillus subtilis TaxID=1423 RepID=UPI0016435CD7
RDGWSIRCDELMINRILGGVFGGVGIGMIMGVGGRRGGSGIVGRIGNKYLEWNMSYGVLFFDLMVVFRCYFIIGGEKMMFRMVMVYIGR